MTKKILCAVDGSDHGKRAIGVAAEIAKGAGAELILVAVDQVFMDGRSAAVHKLGSEQMGKLLADAQALATQHGAASVRTVGITARDVARSILNYADEHQVDHIVVGTGEKSAATRLVIGSVSHDLVTRAHCSVTVAR